MSRVILNNKGQREDPAWVADFEKRQRDEAGLKIATAPGLNKIMAAIRFDILRSLFGDLARKSGVDPSDMNFQERDQVFICEAIQADDGGDAGGHFDYITNTTRISNAILENAVRKGKNKRIALLHFIIHEICHAISAGKIRGLREVAEGAEKEKEPFFQSVENVCGYMVSRMWRMQAFGYGIGKREIGFHLFDEGVTEHMAQDILAAYLKEDENFVARADAKAYIENPFPAYIQSQVLVSAMVRQIARCLDFDEKVVWKAIYRSKIEGMDVTQKKNQALFKGVLPDNFFGRLAVADTKEMLDLWELIHEAS